MVEKREWRWVTWVTVVMVIAAGLPFLLGWLATPQGARFTGLIYNPLDGHTYLSKMRLGADGSWLFHLTYTSEPHQGAFVYLFYLLLGHLSRWLGGSLLATYHGIRMVGGAALFFGIYRLAADLVVEVKHRRLVFLLAALGAGLGWLAGPLGWQTPDLWVAEAFPFAAFLTNAHFPMSLALMVWTAHWGLRIQDSRRYLLGVGAGLVLLGGIQPFGLIALVGGLLGTQVVTVVRQRKIPWRSLAWLGLVILLALPYPVYTLWAVRADPVLRAWSEQNLTPSPSLWDWLLGVGLLGPLALLGAARAVRRGRRADGLLLGWTVATVIGLLLPLDLARRLSLGLGLVVGLLAGMGFGEWAQRLRKRTQRLLTVMLLAISIMTPLFLLMLGTGAALQEYALLYLTDGEWEALTWMRDHLPRDAVVLCSPEMGIFVPAWAGQRVVYGHPFETVDAESRKEQVAQFWLGERDVDWLDSVGVDYIFYGPRERSLGDLPEGELVFESQDAAVYRR